MPKKKKKSDSEIHDFFENREKYIHINTGDLKSLIVEGMDKTDISLRELAKKVGVSASYLSRFLTSQRNAPKDEILLKIGKILNVDPPESLLIHNYKIPKDRDILFSLMLAACSLDDNDLRPLVDMAWKLVDSKPGFIDPNSDEDEDYWENLVIENRYKKN